MIFLFTGDVLISWNGELLPLLHAEVSEVRHVAPVRRGVEGKDGGEIDVAEEDVEEEVDQSDGVLERSPTSNIVKNVIKIFDLLSIGFLHLLA